MGKTGKTLKTMWEYFGYILTIYAIYRQINLANELRQEVYENLPLKQKAQLDALKSTIITPTMTASGDAPDLLKIKANV